MGNKHIEKFEHDHPDLTEDAMEDLRDKLKIDKYALDENVASQPTLFDEVSERVSTIASIRDHAKTFMENKSAEVGAKYRKKASDSKVTEPAVKEAISNDVSYKKAVSFYLHMKYLTSRWEALKSSFEQRASMLSKMVGLYTSNYFTTTSIRGDSDVRELETTRHRKKIAAKRNQKRSSRK